MEKWITTVDYFSQLTDEQKATVMFQMHNFGDRGSSSVESAAIGGFAHLTQFMGTDNFNSLKFCTDYYGSGAEIAGYSVFATEHSTTTSHGIKGEEEFVIRMLEENPDAPIMSFVADSYDVYAFTEFCTNPNGKIRQIIESRPHQKFVLRPDSGEPLDVLYAMFKIMEENKVFDVKIDDKVLSSNFGVLWGDGITPEVIEDIVKAFTKDGYAAENFVFGSGGDLMQNVTRDTQRFAVKCSSISVLNDCDMEVDVDVFKDPITDPGKKSKKGKVTTFYNPTTETYFVDKIDATFDNGAYCVLETVYEDGVLIRDMSLADIRKETELSKSKVK